VPAAWRYEVRAGAGLHKLEVRVCFDGVAPERLIPGEAFAYDFLLHARDDRGAPLEVVENGIRLPERATGRCFDYGVDLDRLTDYGSRTVGRRVGRDIVLSHDAWLWRPNRYRTGPDIRLTMHTPEGTQVSTPWPQLPDGSYRVPRSTLVRQGYVALGRFEVHDIEVPGGVLHTVVLDAEMRAGPQDTLRWIETSARAVATLYGSFPRANTQVIVSPTDWGDGVGFGWVVRGGGPSVNLLVGRDATFESLADDWVVVHEMSHLAVPFIQRGEPWLSEGIATWYQNVLRARAGLISERVAWEKLVDGFDRGQSSVTGRTLREDAARMRDGGLFLRVYWAGTAWALLSDVELRRSSGGHKSLDDALRGLRDCCLDTELRYAAVGLCSELDRAAGADVFARLAERERERSEWPAEVDRVLRELGVIVTNGRVSLDDNAKLAHIRRAIMSPRR
jgi:hypothetical protein